MTLTSGNGSSTESAGPWGPVLSCHHWRGRPEGGGGAGRHQISPRGLRAGLSSAWAGLGISSGTFFSMNDKSRGDSSAKLAGCIAVQCVRGEARRGGVRLSGWFALTHAARPRVYRGSNQWGCQVDKQTEVAELSGFATTSHFAPLRTAPQAHRVWRGVMLDRLSPACDVHHT